MLLVVPFVVLTHIFLVFLVPGVLSFVCHILKDIENTPEKQYRQSPIQLEIILTAKSIDMTLNQVVKEIYRIALAQKNVRYVGQGDLYKDLNSNPGLKYDIVYLTQNQHQTVEGFDRYSFNIFYISRLGDFDATNALQIQSIGKEVIENIVRIFCEQYDADVYGTTYWQPFTQRFSDLTAGIYAQITIEIAADTCIDE